MQKIETEQEELIAKRRSTGYSLEAEKYILPRRSTKVTARFDKDLSFNLSQNLFEKQNEDNTEETIVWDLLKSTIKIQKQRQLAKKSTVKNMRDNLPQYTKSEIRMFRLPLHEALLINLKDGGFHHTAEYIEALIEFQERMRNLSGYGSVIYNLPQLKFSTNEIMMLSESLQTTEQLHSKKLYDKECEELLRLGIIFGFGNGDWWWLGEQIFIQSIRISLTNSSKVENKSEALSRYVYAKFLLENLKEYENASKQLNIARYLAVNKLWSSKNLFPEAKGTLFIQINRVKFECVIKEVEQSMKNDPENAIILANEARKRALEACYKQGESRALVLKGICEMLVQRPKLAISSFLRALNIQNKLESIVGMCKIRIQLAKAYLMDNCANSSLNVLMDLKKDADRFNLPYYLAEAYKNLGEYYLLTGDPDKATHLLEESIRVFNESHIKGDEVTLAKMLKAIASGLQLFPMYVTTIAKSQKPGITGRKHFLNLIKWKNERTPFWKESNIFSKYHSCDVIIMESLKRVEQSRANILDEKLQLLTKSSMEVKQTKEQNVSATVSTIRELLPRKSKIEHPSETMLSTRNAK